MIVCPKCNKELNEGTKFCDACGAEISEKVFCPECGQETSAEFDFCQNCGAKLFEEAAETSESEPEFVPEVPAEKKAFPKLAFIIGGIAAIVAVILVVVTFVLPLFGGSKVNSDYALYLKDDELYIKNLKNNKPGVELTSKLAGDLDSASHSVGNYATLSKDGKYIFFPDKIDTNGYNLYYKKASKPNSDAVKIDSGLSSYYHVNESATLVTYKKGDNLYQYNVKKDEKEKIASDVYGYRVSEDGKKFIYTNDESTLYFKDGKKDKVKIASEVSLEDVSEDFKTVYYTDEDNLYKHVVGKDKEKIDSDVYTVLYTYDSGEMYYLKSEDKEISLMDYVIDDMKEEDENMEEPEYPDMPDSPSYYDYNSYDEYDEAWDDWSDECDRLRDEYYDAMDIYYEKESRDRLRNSLKGATMSNSSYTLCYYNGKKSTVITESFDYNSYDYDYASGNPVIAYTSAKTEDVKKVKLSEINSTYEVESKVNEALNSSKENYIAIKDVATLVKGKEKIQNMYVNGEGSVAYYFDDVSEKDGHGELYRISLSNKVGKAELYDKDVYSGTIRSINEKDVAYFKDYKDNEGEFFINKKKVSDDAYAYGITTDYDNKKVFYYTDWSDEKSQGTLNVYNGSKTSKISDDVYTARLLPDGKILYLYDYSKGEGELYQWNGRKAKKIDEDVTAVYDIYYDED